MQGQSELCSNDLNTPIMLPSAVSIAYALRNSDSQELLCKKPHNFEQPGVVYRKSPSGQKFSTKSAVTSVFRRKESCTEQSASKKFRRASLSILETSPYQIRRQDQGFCLRRVRLNLAIPFDETFGPQRVVIALSAP